MPNFYGNPQIVDKFNDKNPYKGLKKAKKHSFTWVPYLLVMNVFNLWQYDFYIFEFGVE